MCNELASRSARWRSGLPRESLIRWAQVYAATLAATSALTNSAFSWKFAKKSPSKNHSFRRCTTLGILLPSYQTLRWEASGGAQIVGRGR